MANETSLHDRLFKVTMSKPEAAKEFLQQYLPLHIKNLVQLDTLKLQPDSFIDERLKGHLVDILYSVNFGNKPGYIYVLFEHLSTSDEMIAFRLIKYMLNIMDHHIIKTKGKKLPLVFPIVIYTGNAKYSAPKSIFDLFEEKSLAEEVFLRPYKFIDIKDIPDEELQQQIWFGLMARVFKYKFTKMLEFVDKILPSLITVDQKGDIKFIDSVIKYIIKRDEIEDKDKFFDVLTSNLSQPASETIMTIAEQLRQEGMQQGMHLGEEKARELFARNLLKENESIERIAKLTGLSIENIKKIKKEMAS